MNRTYVLDASALLVLVDNRPHARRVNKLIEEADRLNATLMGSVVNLGEVFYLAWLRHGEQAARDTLDDLSQLPIQIVSVDAPQALKPPNYEPFTISPT